MRSNLETVPDREELKQFVSMAGDELTSVRRELLLASQTGEIQVHAALGTVLARLKLRALELELFSVSDVVGECTDLLERTRGATASAANEALDLVGRVEEMLWLLVEDTDDHSVDVNGSVERSFAELLAPQADKNDFELDDETREIFRSEAADLLGSMENELQKLTNDPADKTGIWNLRRHAHTFKGAAGIVGLTAAADLAHQMEDVLGQTFERGDTPDAEFLGFLSAASMRLASMISEKTLSAGVTSLPLVPEATASPVEKKEAAKELTPTVTPVVRVSLDRLDELISFTRELLVSKNKLSECVSGLAGNTGSLRNLDDRLAVQSALIDQLHERLLNIRMVKFATLHTRLSRAVNVTCSDEGKKAGVVIGNGEAEMDTLMIDSLIEPLLHLLKNAVVHGIETPEIRRMLGKPEKGNISLDIYQTAEFLTLSVTDDGAGLSAGKLRKHALMTSAVSPAEESTMTDGDVFQLIFNRGFTTAERIDLNAGRGVGMSIVKESIENIGGTVTVESRQQIGTTFTVTVPIVAMPPRPTVTIEPYLERLPIVLVVDDSASVRRQTSMVVEDAGLKVVTACDGVEALSYLRSGKPIPELILSDVEMPVMDGWELLGTIKSDSALRDVPVVMVTSLDPSPNREKAKWLGADGYVIKPSNEEELVSVIEKFCSAVAV